MGVFYLGMGRLRAACLASLFFFLGMGPAIAQDVGVYAAADLQLAMRALTRAFEQENPQAHVKVTFGSSGKGYAQLASGSPHDLFFSADMGYAERLAKEGLALTKPKPYGLGRLVVLSLSGSQVDVSKGLEALLAPTVKKIAIANPEHAPYGMAAKEALEKAGMWNKVKNKLVIAENISQAAHYVLSGAAEVGLIALPLAIEGELAQKGRYALVPEELHRPLVQGFVVMKRAENNPAALGFAEFIESSKARKIFSRYGFVLPPLAR
jgi:molybdate transport system substrate-binding protein